MSRHCQRGSHASFLDSPGLHIVYHFPFVILVISQGWTALGHRLREWAKLAGKAVIAVSLLMGLIPLLFGLLLELVVLTPVRVPLHQSPIYFLWQVITVLISRLKGYLLLYPTILTYAVFYHQHLSPGLGIGGDVYQDHRSTDLHGT